MRLFKSSKEDEMHPLEELTGMDEDEGYYGVHVGDINPWLAILSVDYQRDLYDAIAIEIDSDGMFLLDDPAPIDKGSVPDSFILVWNRQMIPGNRIRTIPIDYELVEAYIKSYEERRAAL